MGSGSSSSSKREVNTAGAHDSLPTLISHTPFFQSLYQCDEFSRVQLSISTIKIIAHFRRMVVPQSSQPIEWGRRDMLFVEKGEMHLVSMSPQIDPTGSSESLLGRKRGAGSQVRTVLKTVRENEMVGLMELIQGVEEDLNCRKQYPTGLVAHRESQLVVITQASYGKLKKLVSSDPVVAKFCANLESLTRSSTVEWLQKVDFFRTVEIDRQQYQLLSKIAHFRSYHPGQVIIKQGASADRLYVVVSGELSVTCKLDMRRSINLNKKQSFTESEDAPELPPDTIRRVGTLKTGDFFGESALLTEDFCALSASASVTTTAQTLLLYFEPAEFRSACFFMPNISTKINENMKTRYSSQLLAMELPIFQHLKQEELSLFTQAFQVQMFDTGSVIFKEDSSGDEFYILLQGIVKLSSANGKVAHTYSKKGDYFGELALIRSEPRAATLIAVEPAALAQVQGAKFRALFLQSPTAAAEFELRALKERSSVSALLLHPATKDIIRESLDKDFATENYKVWEVIQEYRALWYKLQDDVSHEATVRIRDNATQVYETFLCRTTAQAENQVNVSAKALKTLAKLFAKDKHDDDTRLEKTIFDGTERCAEENLQGNQQRFVRSPEFASVLKGIGAVPDNTKGGDNNLKSVRQTFSALGEEGLKQTALKRGSQDSTKQLLTTVSTAIAEMASSAAEEEKKDNLV